MLAFPVPGVPRGWAGEVGAKPWGLGTQSWGREEEEEEEGESEEILSSITFPTRHSLSWNNLGAVNYPFQCVHK